MVELLKGEIWKDVEGYDGIYKISNYGRLISYYKKNGHGVTEIPKLLKGKIDKDGYIEYALSKNGILKHKRGHRIVAEAFLPNAENKPEVNHIDGNKSNNYESNLEWCTTSENGIHKYKNGLGEKSREVASYIHGRECKLIDIHNNNEYIFNSLSKCSEFLGKHNRWLKDMMRKKNFQEDIYKLGFYLEVEDKRTYERIIKK